eukprot:TRINITY_DN1533_c0_g1_i1.p3 TRINITY_DN1533_c0_g1~~TRINITY_DN1533_c0_g1_i1.p3  ORF type:complete len:119 (+),score=8.30 TRINITY_DN1533_c0_g1_i1:157-513(+)
MCERVCVYQKLIFEKTCVPQNDRFLLHLTFADLLLFFQKSLKIDTQKTDIMQIQFFFCKVFIGRVSSQKLNYGNKNNNKNRAKIVCLFYGMCFTCFKDKKNKNYGRYGEVLRCQKNMI